MKNLKIFLLIFVTFSSCDMEENPPYLDENVYNDTSTVGATLDGIYAALASYNAQTRRYIIVNGYSGFFNTRKQGANINNPNNANLFSLKPTSNDSDSAQLWSGLYSAIGRTNAAIANIPVDNSENISDNSLLFNDVAGQARFVRAWCYFSLVRLYGDIPLVTALPSSDNLMVGLSPAKEIYSQIIVDAEIASNLINGAAENSNNNIYIKSYAANMLLAKVYMTLATNPQLVPDELSGSNFWQLAYEQASAIYGQYSLLADYPSLFTLENENSVESIFELQITQAASNSQMGRNFTPNNYKAGQCFGWFSVNKDIYDNHAATYPGDVRLEGATIISEYTNNNPASNWFGNTQKTYPSRNRQHYRNAHPYLFKFANKDIGHSNQYDDRNILIYRYADLLLMLAEISNELQNGEQLGYVTEVLNRSNLNSNSFAIADQETFRDLIMNEYKYELLGEGEDAHNNRRRGFDYFLNNVIIPHNTNSSLNFSAFDLTLSEDESQVMYLPLPATEINTNELIN